jgi:hypothetical protein
VISSGFGRNLRRVLLEHMAEIAASVTAPMLSHLLWRSSHKKFTSTITPFRSKVNDPIATSNHIKIVLNTNN